jgi:TRAP-type C4-dicarboxylate transport system permease small subunit
MSRRGIAPAAEATVGQFVEGLARLLAIAGGIVLTALAVMSAVSIIGRAFTKLGLGPVPGDFELIEAGCAVAIFAFLPWCQFRGGHVTVDLMAQYLPPRVWTMLAVVGNLAMSVIGIIVTWELWHGLSDKFSNGETSMIIEMPIWWGYAAGSVSAFVFAVTCVYTVWRSLNEAIAGGEPTP